MEEIFVYCIRKRAGGKEFVDFTTGAAASFRSQTCSMAGADGRPRGTIFKLGPFLDIDEAMHVESQLHRLSSKFRVPGERFYANPLRVPEFWDWVDAQILPIDVCEETA